jgi:hypothetical protein
VIGALGVQVVLRWPPEFFHGFPSLVAGVLVVACTVFAWRRSSRRIRRVAGLVAGSLAAAAVVFAIPLVVAILMIRSEAVTGEHAARSAIEDIGSSRFSTQLATAAADIGSASRTMSGWLTAASRWIPVVSQQGRFVTDTLRSAAAATSVGAKEAPDIEYRLLGYHDGQINLTRLRAMRVPISTVDHELRISQRALVGVTSSWLLWPLGDRATSYEHLLARATRSASLAVEASKVIPAMLGGDGSRNYLVVFMTPSESRGYDGLIGSYGLLTATQGHVGLTKSGSITDIGDALPATGGVLTGPADFIARYGGFDPGKFPGNETYSPDLPTVSQVLAQIYPQAGGPRIDGVMALDPYGLAALLHFTGPIAVPGISTPLSQQNASQVLLTTQYTTFNVGSVTEQFDENELRHDVLQFALHVAFDKLTTGSLPAPQALSAVLDPAVVAGRISLWSFHPDEQPLLRRLGIDGSFPRASGGDLLAVTTQNVGQNKIDAYLHKTVVDHISYDPGQGAVRSEMTVTLRNEAPSSGLPPIVIDNPGAPGLPPGVNRTWLTLYSPLSFRRMSIDGVPGSMSEGEELGVKAYSTYVDVPPDGTVTVRVILTGKVAPGPSLGVTVRVQPSANPQKISVLVAPGGSWRLGGGGGGASERWILGTAMRQRRVFSFVPA